MTIDKIVMIFAGSVIVLSVLLSVLHSPHWLWLSAFVGINLAQAGITGFCPLAKILKMVGIRPGVAFN